jgi:hypothetical protein
LKELVVDRGDLLQALAEFFVVTAKLACDLGAQLAALLTVVICRRLSQERAKRQEESCSP